MITLLGSTGYVGQAYQNLLRAKGIPFTGLTRATVDYTQRDTLIRHLRETRPAFLINVAGYTGKPNVDACERDKAACLMGNAVLPGIVREACEATGTPWGHVSSGCIFTGNRPDGRGFLETDAPNFSFRQNHCSFYSGTKALGEEVLGYAEAPGADGPAWVHQDGAPTGYVWRLRIPFDGVDSPRNYLTKLMRYDSLLEATNSLSQLDEFVRATVECWEKRVPFGIYNVTNLGCVTTREVVDQILRSGVCRKDYKFFKNEDEFMKLAAKTPRSNCTLDTTKLTSVGIRMTEVHEAVARALAAWRA